VPEWKKDLFPKTITFGKRTSLSMKEQRESLPIFQFRDKLLEAVNAAQILVVVGETVPLFLSILLFYFLLCFFPKVSVISLLLLLQSSFHLPFLSFCLFNTDPA
jgi:hypothetical protein